MQRTVLLANNNGCILRDNTRNAFEIRIRWQVVVVGSYEEDINIYDLDGPGNAILDAEYTEVNCLPGMSD